MAITSTAPMSKRHGGNSGDAVSRHDRQFTSQEHDLLLAANLTHHLRSGGQPAQMAASMRLDPGEVVFASIQTNLHIYTGSDVVLPGSSWVAFGSPMMMLGTLAGSAALNRHSRRKAEKEAAPQC